MGSEVGMSDPADLIRNRCEEDLRQIVNNQKPHYFKEYIDANNYRLIKDKSKVDELNTPGVYLIYDGDEIIYIGSAGLHRQNSTGRPHALKYRIEDLFIYYKRAKNPYHHTLTRKLCKKYNIDRARQFYMNKCNFKYFTTRDVSEARTLESVLIMLFKPKYNSESESY